MQKQWTISTDGITHIITYHARNMSGNIKVQIDGVFHEYVPTVVKGVGLLVKLDIPGQHIILHISMNGKDAKLAVNGVYVDSQQPADEKVTLEAVSSLAGDSTQLQKKVKTGFGSFITFVAFTFVNLLLLMINADLSFPFSATVPQLPLAIGKMFYEEDGLFFMYAAGIIIALLCAGVYLLLFFLSKKYIAPIYITIALIIIDTVVLLAFILDDPVSGVVDILFHIWVVWSMVNLLRSKLALNRALKDEFANSGIMDTQQPD